MTEISTFNMSPMLQTNDPGTGGAGIHSPDRFFTFKKLKILLKGNASINISKQSSKIKLIEEYLYYFYIILKHPFEV